MSAEVPLLTLEQVDELSSIVHNIQHENKKKLEEALSELVDISATNILGTFNNMQLCTASSLTNGPKNKK